MEQLENNEPPRRHYGKHDVEMAKIAKEIESSANLRANIKTVLQYLTKIVLYICIAVCICTNGSRLPETLNSLAEVIRQYNLMPTLQLIVIIFLCVVIAFKNKRIKRLTEKAGDKRHKIEYNDANNERSGLRPDGTAIEDEKED